MKLTTFQSIKAFENLQKKGFLITNPNFVNKEKYGIPYNWIISNMTNIYNPYNAQYPLWAWVKYGKISCPPKHKTLAFFGDNEDMVVKITFEKTDKDVLITDFVKYSFLLTNEYIPSNKFDEEQFNQFMIENNVTSEDLLAYTRRDKYPIFRTDNDFDKVNSMVNHSFKKILELETNFLQGTVWDIKLEEVISSQFIKRSECSSRKISRNFRKEYLSTLK